VPYSLDSESIIRSGEVGESMYFIKSGLVEGRPGKRQREGEIALCTGRAD